jgi:hypothetical protein
MQIIARKDAGPQLAWGVLTTLVLLGVAIAPWLRFLVAQ